MQLFFTRFWVILLLTSSSLVYAQKENDKKVLLHTGSISHNSILWNKGTNARINTTISQPELALLLFKEHPGEKERSALSTLGIHLQSYIPQNAWTVVIDRPVNMASLVPYGVAGMMELTAEMKVAQELLNGEVPSWATNGSDRADLWLRHPPYFRADSVKKWLQEEGASILKENLLPYHTLALRVEKSKIRDLASKVYVEFLQAAPSPDMSSNARSQAIAARNALKPGNATVDGLTGAGVVVGVGDDSDPLMHIDLSGRLINRFITIEGSGHGIHTMGTVGGGGIIREEMAGYAPESKIVANYYSNIISNAEVYKADFNMTVTSNSYGNSVYNDNNLRRYDITSYVLDELSSREPVLLNVFAAGNSGNTQISGNPYISSITGENGFGTVLSGYQSAKNTLVVGNISSTLARSVNSSKGPVSGGRVKPDLMALGASVRSSFGKNDYFTLSGTSQAAPAVAGGAALLTEQFRLQYPSEGYPTAALLKALLCNGATDLGHPGPDFSFGYGVMNLYRSLEMLKNGRFIMGSVTSGAIQTGTISVPVNTAKLKVMLYWSDVSGSPLSSQPLVNDLDLRITVGGNQVFPFINNSDPAYVNQPATTGVDHVNNMEQVVITNPPAGNVTYTIEGSSVPRGPQQFVLVYDFLPVGTQLNSPFGGEKFVPGDAVHIYWDSQGDDTDFHLEYFNGSEWVRIASDIASNVRNYEWTLPAGFFSDKARVRIIRTLDNQISTSGEFTVIGRPTVTLENESLQCQGTIALKWTSVPNASSYEILRLVDDRMKVVGATPAEVTSYRLHGLSKDTTYWVSVRAVLNDRPGLRAFAVSRKPDGGACGGTWFAGDYGIEGVVSPQNSGRVQTSSALSANQVISFNIRNLTGTDQGAKGAQISYSINGAPAVIENITIPALSSNAVHTVAFSNTANLSAPAQYNIEISLQVPGDPISENNQILHSIAQLSNPAVALNLSSGYYQFLETLESMEENSYYFKQYGLAGASRFDFESNDKGGRIRTFVNTGFALSGSKAVTIDADSYPHTMAINYLTGTYNLSNFNASADDIRLDFFYMQHGQWDGNHDKLWIRGNDTSPWIEAFDLFKNRGVEGEYKRSASIELSRLLINAGQNFSTSTQFRWAQSGMYQAATPAVISGYSIDDIRLYRPTNDVQMKEIVSPVASGCSLGTQEAVTIKVYNSMFTPLTNVEVRYRVNSGVIVTETIPYIGAGATIEYTFSQRANLSIPQVYTILCWVNMNGDNVTENNSLTVNVWNTPTVTTFPYLQDFESNRGNWYTTGDASSWDWGVPSANRINKAASGSRAWKTKLSGNYNEREFSYLYSPCFEIGSLTKPALSFMMALDIEDCGNDAFCDLAWVEYSYNGSIWNRLGNEGEGTNWYNKTYSNGSGWAHTNYSRWHVASIDLPLPPAPGATLRLRFVMKSDIFKNREGIAIDDVHIYDKQHEIHSGNVATPPAAANISSGTNTWTNFISDNQIIAALNPGNGPAPGLTNVQTHLSASGVNFTSNTYYHPRHYVVQPSNASLGTNTRLRLYFSDAEMEEMIAATGCAECIKATSVLDLGISKFSHADKSVENGLMSDNQGGIWNFIPATEIKTVPYGHGYYLELANTTFSEFWLSPAAINFQGPLPVRLSAFDARLEENVRVLLSWEATEITSFSHFEVQRARGNEALENGNFETIGLVRQKSDVQNRFRFADEQIAGGVYYYRLKMVDRDGSYRYSDLRSVIITSETKDIVYPNPSADGIFFLGFQHLGEISVVVRDMLGKSVMEKKVISDGFQDKMIIDLRQVSPGMYVVEVASPAGITAHKVVRN